MLHLCDHTMLDPDGDVEAFLDDAEGLGFAAVCLLPMHVSAAVDRGHTVACAAGGFPNGDGDIAIRTAEIRQALADGAEEIDVVLDFDALMEGRRDKVVSDLVAMRSAAGDAVLKVILETPELDLAYVELAARLALEFGADFVKTCSGRRGGCTPLVAQALAELLAEWNAEHPTDVRGLKLSGGIREVGQAEGYLDIVRTALGDGFVHPATFRFGSSRRLD